MLIAAPAITAIAVDIFTNLVVVRIIMKSAYTTIISNHTMTQKRYADFTAVTSVFAVIIVVV